MAINYFKKFFFDFRHMRTRSKALVLGVIILLIIGAFALGQKSRGVTEEVVFEETIPEVVVASVASLSSEQAPLFVIGSVSSRAEVVMRAEAQGPILRLLKNVGDKVFKGEIIAEVENSAQRAAVSQARAGLAAAEAGFNQTVTGAKSEEVAISEQALEAARKGLEDTISTQDTLVENARKTLLSAGLEARHVSDNPQGGTPIISGVYNSQKEGTYSINVYQTGSGAFFSTSGLEVGDQKIQAGLSVPLGTKGLAITFPSNLSTSDSWTVNVPNPNGSGYLVALNAYNSSLESRGGVVRQAEERVNAAQAQLNLVKSGATSEQVSSSRALVDQALAALRVAEANLAKTVIRAPLSGVITSLPISTGDFVSMFQPLVTVANNDTLEVLIYLTQSDGRGIVVGDQVLVDGRLSGLVGSIAPALDNVTQKIEVKIILEDGADLFNGQSVQVSFSRDGVVADLDELFVPLSALKITAAGVVVFTVNSENKLEAKPINEGPLAGDKVLVLKGLLPTDQVVVDARGLKVGQLVSITE